VKKGYLYIGLAALLFSTMEIALKRFSFGLNPFQLNFLRFTIGALILLPLALRTLRKRPPLKAADLYFFAFSGLVCVVVSMGFYQVAVARTPAAVVAVIFSCNPVFVTPLAGWLLKEKVSGRTLATLAASLAGIACIAAPAFMKGAALGLSGIAFTVISALTFAFYGVLGKARSARYGGVAMTCLSFIAGAAELLVLIGVSHIAPLSRALTGAGLGVMASVPVLAGISLPSLPGLLYVGACITGLGYAFWFLGMEETSAQTGSIVFFIKPALAPLLAWLILGEDIGPLMAVGMALIIGGSVLAAVRPARRA
jgi:drug/metabolite transporter (DMT)-like permease